MTTSWKGFQSVTGDQGHPPALNATILYEDLSTGLRANSLFHRITRQLDFNGSEVELLRMDLLENSMIKSVADRAAAESGLVILSTHRQGQLAIQVENWIKNWFARKKANPAAVVLLLDGNGYDRPETNPIARQIKRLADANNVECFSYFFEGNRDEDFLVPRAPGRNDAPSLFPAMREENHQMRFWGINE